MVYGPSQVNGNAWNVFKEALRTFQFKCYTKNKAVSTFSHPEFITCLTTKVEP